MLKKWMDRIFCLLFVLLLVVPLVTMNFEKDQISEIDNSYLPELTFSPTRQFLSEVEDYINARMGFRTEILDLYQQLNAKIFRLMEHPSYMYGENGQVFFRLEKYIKDYQHRNLDPEWTEHFTDMMQRFQTIAEEHGAGFLYMLLPDKKTVYAEDFPKTIRQIGDVSRTDQVLAALSEKGVNTFFPKDILIAGKEHMSVANRQYDVGHWNENGAFLTYRALTDGPLREVFPKIEPITAEEYRVVELHKDTLPSSRFLIDENVPHYEPLDAYGAKRDDSLLDAELSFLDPAYYDRHYFMEDNVGKPRLLIIHDSYMMEHEKFFVKNFSEVIFIHRYNITGEEAFEKCLSVLQPDMVIYENPERSHPIRFTGVIEVEAN